MNELEQIRERLNAASKGPWQAGVAATSDGSEVCTTYEQKKAFLALSLNDGDRPLWIVDNGEVIPAATGDGPNAGHNAELIAHAPTDLARLVAAVEAGLAACDRVIDNTDGHKPPGPPHPTQQQATAVRIRAALSAALGDER